MNEGNSLEKYFGDVPDPRVVGRSEYKGVEIIVITACAVLCGAEGWEDIDELGDSISCWSSRITLQDVLHSLYLYLSVSANVAISIERSFSEHCTGVGPGCYGAGP